MKIDREKKDFISREAYIITNKICETIDYQLMLIEKNDIDYQSIEELKEEELADLDECLSIYEPDDAKEIARVVAIYLNTRF